MAVRRFALIVLAILPLTAVADEPAQPKANEVITDSIGMKLTLISAGEFTMGAARGEKGYSGGQGPPHQVRITKPFYLGTYEVTQAQWQAVMGTTPWKEFHHYVELREGPDYPATYVSWDEAVEFCRKLSKREARGGHKGDAAVFNSSCVPFFFW